MQYLISELLETYFPLEKQVYIGVFLILEALK